MTWAEEKIGLIDLADYDDRWEEVTSECPDKVVRTFRHLVLPSHLWPECFLPMCDWGCGIARRLVHERVRRRENFIRQQVACLIRRFRLIAVETLVVRNMVKNPRLAKSIADAARLSFFAHLLEPCGRDWPRSGAGESGP